MRELLQFFIALLIHECGHIIASLFLSIPVVSFDIRSLGGVFTFDFSHTGYIKEGILHFCGPLFGIIIACLIYLIYGQSSIYFVGISLALSCVNLLPIEGFDGGGICRCILSLFLLPDTVWKIGKIFSIVGVVVLWTAVIWTELRAGGNIGLMIFVIGIMLGKMK